MLFNERPLEAGVNIFNIHASPNALFSKLNLPRTSEVQFGDV